MLTEALEVAQRKMGEDHPICLSMMDNLAELYDQQKRHDQAEAQFRKVLALRQKKLGEEHPDVLTTMHGLAIAVEHQGRREEAKELLRRVIEVRKRVQGVDHPDLASAQESLGGYELRDKRFTEAEGPLRDALAIWQKHVPGDYRRFATESGLGASLVGQKKFAEAEPLLLSAHAGLKEREARIPQFLKGHIAAAVDRLVELYVAQGQEEKAEAWRKQRPAGAAEEE
jgi:tetratricopeptide (TPR) repeat protein